MMTEEYDVDKSMGIIATAITMCFVVAIIGIDEFMSSPLFLVLWIVVGTGAIALGYLISLVIYVLTQKNYQNIVLPICTVILVFISVLRAGYEKQSYFIGEADSPVILFFFTIPLAIAAVVGIVNFYLQQKKKRI